MEVVFEVPIEIAEEAMRKIEDIFESTVTLRVPLKFECKICSDWSQMKDDDFHGLDTANYRESILTDYISDTTIGYGLAEFSALFF